MKKNIKNLFVSFLSLAIIFSCNLFGPNITGVWDTTDGTDSKMTLQQNGSNIQGYAYTNGQNQGTIAGKIDGSSVTLQVRNISGAVIIFTGEVSSDGVSMQLRSNKNTTLLLFKSR